jgi:hypothetical protein
MDNAENTDGLYIITVDTGQVVHQESLDTWDLVKSYIATILEPTYIESLDGHKKLVGVMTKDGERFFGVMEQDAKDGVITLENDKTTIKIKL